MNASENSYLNFKILISLPDYTVCLISENSVKICENLTVSVIDIIQD